jgi:hypothetical protein
MHWERKQNEMRLNAIRRRICCLKVYYSLPLIEELRDGLLVVVSLCTGAERPDAGLVPLRADC